jgi:hypothetical protein
MPKRIQRQRTKGWTMPEGAVYVGRPTLYGNATTVHDYFNAGFSGSLKAARQWAVEQYRFRLFDNGWMWMPAMREQLRADLRGKDLACWCPLNQPCHADVLLELANQ